MILKGSQRAGGSDLATHLMNSFDNESVEIAEVYGTVAGDLHGAFAEMEAVAAGTKAENYLYSLSINPSAPLTREQYHEAISIIEDRLGLSDQPRAVVFHVKPGNGTAAREHCHVVWSKIDAGNMKAIHMAYDHSKLCDLSCELAHRYGLELPPGLKAWEEKRRFEKDYLEATMAENAQAKETGVTPEQRQVEITAAYSQTDTAEGFQNALLEKGYILAQGARRAFVAVDGFGKAHSLTRYVKGYKAKEVRGRLRSLDLAELPTVDEAREQVQAMQQAAEDRAREQTQAIREQALGELKKQHAQRRLPLNSKEQDLLTRHASERMALHAAQRSESRSVIFRIKTAVLHLIDKTPGLRSVLSHITKNPNLNPEQRHALETRAVDARHARERSGMEREKRSMASVEARELLSLERKLRRQISESEKQSLAPDAAPDGQEKLQHLQAELEEARTAREEAEELFVTFNDAAEFVEGTDRAGDDDEDRAPSWKERAEKTRRGHRPRRGKGYGYRRDE